MYSEEYRFMEKKASKDNYLDINKERINKLKEPDRKFFIEIYYNYDLKSSEFSLALVAVTIAIIAIFLPSTQSDITSVSQILRFIVGIVVIIFFVHAFKDIKREEQKRIKETLNGLLKFLENGKKI